MSWRKHCGQQNEWVISLELLKKSAARLPRTMSFGRIVTIIYNEDASHNHMPDYAISFDGSNVKFTNRKSVKALPSPEFAGFPLLDPETYHDARTVAPGYDVHWLEAEWRSFWVDSGKPELKKPRCGVYRFLQEPTCAKSKPVGWNSLFLDFFFSRILFFSPLPSSPLVLDTVLLPRHPTPQRGAGLVSGRQRRHAGKSAS
jgi:hypothetical protein